MPAPQKLDRTVSWLAAIGGLAVALGAVGLLVPRDQTVTRTASFRQDARSLWQAVSDLPQQERWRSDVDRTLALPDRNGHPAWRETGEEGSWTFELTVFDPPNRLVLECNDENARWRGTRTISISDEGSFRRVTIHEAGEVRNVYWRLVQYVLEDRGGLLDEYLTELGEHFGETVESSDLSDS